MTSKKLLGKNGVRNMDYKNPLFGNPGEWLSSVSQTSPVLTSSGKLRDTKWDLRFLELAAHISNWSKDPHTKVGAVIANDKNHIISLGYNGFPRGVADCETRYSDRDVKYKYVCHAERNAIDNAHTDVSNCTLYVTLMPCNECAKSIIQRGIKRVVCWMASEAKPNLNWDVTKTMFQEAGIEMDVLPK